MKCPDCTHPETKVIESRDTEDGLVLRRRRECLSCSSRFTTYERLEMANLLVVKKDGRREKFDRDKLAAGIWRALEKRPVPHSKVEEMIANLQKELRATKETEIPSADIGELVMEKLKEMDEVAYIRFASVYRSFTDLTSFEKELKNLLDIKSNLRG